jgi:arylsulfatase A-like enzyme
VEFEGQIKPSKATDMSYKKHKLILILFTITLVSFCLYGCSQEPQRESTSVNVLLITIDAARADRFPFNGSPTGLTPNIHQLGENGVVFKQAYCYSGNTPGSMGAIFTSKLPYWPLDPPDGGNTWSPKHVYGFTRFFDANALLPGIPDTLDTLPIIFKRQGYTTVGVSSNPYLTSDFGFHRGFDFFEELDPAPQKSYNLVPNASAEKVTRTTQIYLSELRNEKFFIWIHFMDLHEPLLGYAPFREEAKSKAISTPHRPVSEWTEKAKDKMAHFGVRTLPDWKGTEEELVNARNEYSIAYDAELLRVDKQIGIIMETLKQYKLWDNTLVVVLNDHGDEFMEHGYYSHEGQLYEEIVRGIWIMHNPILFRTPVTADAVVSHLDVMPTILELLQFREESQLYDGVSQIPLLKQKPIIAEERFVFGVLVWKAYIYDGNYKLIVDRYTPVISKELYDLTVDPTEQNNLTEHLPLVAHGLYVKMKHVFLKKGIQFWPEMPNQPPEVRKKTLDQLKSLGYIK